MKYDHILSKKKISDISGHRPSYGFSLDEEGERSHSILVIRVAIVTLQASRGNLAPSPDNVKGVSLRIDRVRYETKSSSTSTAT